VSSDPRPLSPDPSSWPQSFTVAPDQAGQRLDVFLTERFATFSRANVRRAIDAGHVRVDGAVCKPSWRLAVGSQVEVAQIDVPREGPIPQNIPLDILYEDDAIVVVNKPAGMVVHPAPGHPRGTLVNALLHHSPEIDLGGSNRPGIVHRLDKDTSGLMVVAKSDRARGALLRQWAERSVTKRYLALVHGVVEPEEGTIDAPVGRDPLNRQRMAVVQNGRPAVTHFKVLRRFANATLLELDLESGRTHQVRVHLAFIGHPIVGDAIYGANPHAPAVAAPRQFLHASRLAFMLPDGEPVSLASALPSDLQAVLDRLIDEEAAAARGR
jgi:23S rRNA pseudouridine1911/1915/1917 synthase